MCRAGGPGQLLLLILLLASYCAPCTRASGKQFYHFRVESRDSDVSTRRGLLRNATLPLHGAVKDYGYFYAAMFLGTPPKKFAVIVDTGSTMTYVPCATCGAGCGPNHQSPAFDPDKSATSTKITCGSAKCACGSPKCSCSAGQCTYTRSYAEQSSSSGVLVEDLLALHDGDPGSPIIFGCETKETGEIYKQRADGLFGLGNSDVSVINQLVKAGVIDNVFSLCFGTVEGEGAMLLGDAPLPPGLQLQYTPLVSSLQHPFYYNVRLMGLSVAGARVPVDQGLFSHGYGTVLDSGTTFTYLPTAAFKAFAAAVQRHALSKGLFKVPGPDPSYEDVCFGGAPHHHDREGLAQAFPSLGLHFDGMEPLILSPLNYLFVHTFNSGKYCLGVFDNGGSGTLIGGITFRDILVRYDRGRQRVGFAHAPCRQLGVQQRPLCPMLEAEGIAVADAERDGDCQPVPPRAQQQEKHPAASKPSSSGSQQGGAGDAGAADREAGGEARPRGESRTVVIVAAGLVGAVLVAAGVLALLISNRDRIRAGLQRLRYRPLTEDGTGEGGADDPESGGLLSPKSPLAKQVTLQLRPLGSGVVALSCAAGAEPADVGGGGSVPSTPTAPKAVPMVEMGTPPGEASKRMGLTTPTKLQRSASASAAAAAAAAAASGSSDEESGGSMRPGMLMVPSSPSAGALVGSSPGRPGTGLARGMGGLASPR